MSWLKRKFNKIKTKVNNICLKYSKVIFLIATAEHDNIGDSAIAQSMINLAKKHFSQYKIVEINVYEYFDKKNWFYSILNKKDMIWIAGGGNLGNVYITEENVRRDVIGNCKNNPIFIFPQSVYFTDDESGQKEAEISRDVYDNNPNLTLFVRDPISLNIAENIFPKTKKILMPDIACSYQYENRFERDGILCCIRDLDDESGLDEEKYKSIFNVLKNQNVKVDYSKNIYKSNVTRDIREEVVQNELDMFAKHKLVVTDRLHGLIFSIITKTPCIVVKSQNHKITGFMEFLKDSNCVKYLDTDVESLDDSIQGMLLLKDVWLPNWENEYFKNLIHFISKYRFCNY